MALRELIDADADTRYLGWMRDTEVLRHLEARFATHTLASLRAFVAEQSARADTLALAIIALPEEHHVGNIKLGPLDPHHGTADVGLLIGEASARGRGIGREAIVLASGLAGPMLGARKLTASCYSGNAASARAFLAAGWSAEGTRAAQFLGADGEPHDQLMFGLLLPEGSA